MEVYLFTSHITDIDNIFFLFALLTEMSQKYTYDKQKWCKNYFWHASKITVGYAVANARL